MNITISTTPFKDYVIGDYMITDINLKKGRARKVNSLVSDNDVDISHLIPSMPSKTHPMFYVRGDLRSNR